MTINEKPEMQMATQHIGGGHSQLALQRHQQRAMINKPRRNKQQQSLDASNNYDAARDDGWLKPLACDKRLNISSRHLGSVIVRQFTNRKRFETHGQLVAWPKPERLAERAGMGLSTVYEGLIELEQHGYAIQAVMAGLIEDKPNKKVKAIILRPQKQAPASAPAAQPEFQMPEEKFQDPEGKIPESGPDSIESNLKHKSTDTSSSPPEYDAARKAQQGPATAPRTDGARSLESLEGLTPEQKRQRVVALLKKRNRWKAYAVAPQEGESEREPDAPPETNNQPGDKQ